MLKSRTIFVLLIGLLFATGMRSAKQKEPAAKSQEKELIAVLESDVPRKAKADACRQLAAFATKESVKPLAALLGDVELSHMARYALEPIPDPAVDEALRDALAKLKGRPLVGVIGSIGVRGDARAVKALTTKLGDRDAEVAQATARALGSIGNLAAAKALREALKSGRGGNQLALYEGLLRCAENLARQGWSEQAMSIYDQLRKLRAPHQVRAGALRGAILTRGNQGLALLRRHLHDDDYILFSAAVQSALELPGSEVTEVLTAGLKELHADLQVLIIQTLGKRGDPAALPALFDAVKRDDEGVRVAAIRALPEIGDASAVPVLTELVADGDSEVSQAAQDALAAIPGDKADAAVMAMLNSNESNMRLIALELIERRRMTASIPVLLEVATGDDVEVRRAALRKVGELGGPAELPALLDMLAQLNSAEDLNAAEQALRTVCTKDDDPQSYSETLINRLVEAEPAQKGSLLRVLGGIGGKKALRVVRRAVNDPDSEVRSAAISVLCEWKTPDAAFDLLTLARTSPEPSRKIVALRGYIRLIRDESLSTENKVLMCSVASVLVERDEEKKLLLGVLGAVPAVEALSMVMEHLDNPAINDEAGFAAVEISEKIVDQEPEEVADAVQKVMQAVDNVEVTDRAKVILDKANKAAGG
jgi:HEAT repeat protein